MSGERAPIEAPSSSGVPLRQEADSVRLERVAMAPGTLIVLVSDSETEQPLEGAFAVIEGTGLGAQTTASGWARLSVSVGLTGRLTLTVRRIGYRGRTLGLSAEQLGEAGHVAAVALSPAEGPCGFVIRASLPVFQLTVRSLASGRAPEGLVTAMARTSTHRDSASATGSGAGGIRIQLAWDTPGTYLLEVRAAGHLPWRREGLDVPGRCGYIRAARELDVWLVPEGPR